MGFRRFNSLSDIAKQGYWLRLTCKCGHMRRGADTRLSHLAKNMKCGQCGKKDLEAAHCEVPLITSR